MLQLLLFVISLLTQCHSFSRINIEREDDSIWIGFPGRVRAELNLGSYIKPAASLPFKIYSCSMYHNEVYVFALKTVIMSPWVHKFVLTVSDGSFSGKTKSNLTFSPFDDIVQALGDRLVIYKGSPPHHSDPWKNEAARRFQVIPALEKIKPDDNDLIIFADFDEFLDEANLRKVVQDPPQLRYVLDSESYYYSLRWRRLRVNGHKWVHPIVSRYSVMKTIKDPEGIERFWTWRGMIHPNITGIHISYAIGSADGIQKKIKSFSHQELNKGVYTDLNRIYSLASCGKWFFHNAEKKPMVLDPKWNYTWLSDPRISWLNSRIPFRYLSPGLRVSKIRKWATCPEAEGAFRNFENY